MSVLNGKDIFTSKYTTAQIFDGSGRMFFVPIKNMLGDYFVTELNRQVYVFRVDSRREKVYRHTGRKSFKVLLYDVSHCMPISTEDVMELDSILKINDLPRISNMQFGIMKYLAKREKKDFVPHDIPRVIAHLEKLTTKYGDKYAQDAMNMVTYLNHLDVKKIATPLKRVTEYLDDDFLATDPGFYGTVISFFKRTDVYHHKINNEPITAKWPMTKLILILGIIAALTVAVVIFYNTGAFDNLLTVPTWGSAGGMTDMQLMQKYPTSESLYHAVQRGEIAYDSLSANAKKMYDSYTPPVVHEINIGE